IYVNAKAEQDILRPEETHSSGQGEAAEETSLTELVVVVVLLFLGGVILIAYTAYARLNKQIAELDAEPDTAVINNIAGSKLDILGLLLRIAGYVLSAAGNQIKADNPV
ncbi:MAG TPA: hypothetical protein VN580_03375, partial [Clostridia bacterium]|nr:hypothetical protein [Clostridia bacterium]